MNESIFIAVIGILAAPLAAFVTWFVNRKKHVAEIYGVLAESSQTAVETMQSTMATLHEELIAAHKKIDDLILENKQMQKEIVELRHQNNLLIEENHILHDKLDVLSDILNGNPETR